MAELDIPIAFVDLDAGLPTFSVSQYSFVTRRETICTFDLQLL